MQGAKTYWFKYWKAHDLFKKVIFKVYSETLKTIFFSDEKMVKVTQLYNSHNKLVYAPQIILRNWSLFQVNNGFCGDTESW